MKKYEGPSIKDVKTDTGKLPANVGFPGNMSGPTNPEGIEGPPDEGVLRAKAHRQLLRNMGISQANIIHPNPPKNEGEEKPLLMYTLEVKNFFSDETNPLNIVGELISRMMGDGEEFEVGLFNEISGERVYINTLTGEVVKEKN